MEVRTKSSETRTNITANQKAGRATMKTRTAFFILNETYSQHTTGTVGANTGSSLKPSQILLLRLPRTSERSSLGCRSGCRRTSRTKLQAMSGNRDSDYRDVGEYCAFAKARFWKTTFLPKLQPFDNDRLGAPMASAMATLTVSPGLPRLEHASCRRYASRHFVTATTVSNLSSRRVLPGHRSAYIMIRPFRLAYLNCAFGILSETSKVRY